MRRALTVLSLLIALSSIASAQGICSRFRPAPDGCNLSAGEKEQAKCLLRPVKKFANLGAPLGSLPAPFDTLVGQPTQPSLSVEAVKAYLVRKSVGEQDVGGSISVRLTRPKYFVIHDTSDLLSSATEFPADINTDSWLPNRLSQRVGVKKTHIYINRLGQSATAVAFESTTPPPGTKFGSCHSSQRTAFLHIENIQPRIRDRSFSFPNDALAPIPGFTDSQLERLALVYLVASVRSGKWLIPAYHSPVDLGYPDRHDDPQNFDLNRWAAKLNGLIAEITSGNAGSPNPVPSPTPSAPPATADAFDLPEPTNLSNGKALWATHYYVYGDAQFVPGGKPLLNMSGANLGVSLSLRDWCKGAIEGTIRAIKANGEAVVYNFAGRGPTVQVNCSSIIHNPSINVPAIGRSRYKKARGSFGDGVENMVLVPYRSIAVDNTAIPFRTVVYIPAARGREIRLPSGQTVRHDGYFFAADTGGAIKRNHIDVFGGVFQGNPFPNFIRSTEMPTFDGFIINDAQISARLGAAHTATGNP